MKLNSLRLHYVIFAVFVFLSSCSKDEDLYESSITEQSDVPLTRGTSQEEGRFDNIPFQWDYFFTTDSTQIIPDGVIVYPVKIEEMESTSSRMAVNNRRDNGGRRPGTGRPGGSWTGDRRRPGSFTTTTSDFLISDPNFIYVGAAFPESEFGRGFNKPLLYPRNPMEVSTSFPKSYFGEITKETGSLGYKKFLTEVLNSSQYKEFVKTGSRKSLEFQCTEYYSYSDIEKAFSANGGLAKIFSAKVQSSSKKTNIKSRLLGQLISKNFDITMEFPVNGFFKDKSKDTSPENPVYVGSITYGKIALLSIESEYSFEEVKKAVEAGIKWKILSVGGNFSSKDVEVLQKSSIVLYIISDDTNGDTSQFFDSIDGIKKSFSLNYSEANFGLPIFCNGFYTKDNTRFTITETSSGGSTRPGSGSSRRDSGSTRPGSGSSRRDSGSTRPGSGSSRRDSGSARPGGTTALGITA